MWLGEVKEIWILDGEVKNFGRGESCESGEWEGMWRGEKSLAGRRKGRGAARRQRWWIGDVGMTFWGSDGEGARRPVIAATLAQVFGDE